MNIQIGGEYDIGWNAAKTTGDTVVAYKTVRVEAAGVDWVVFRDCLGKVYTTSFGSKQEKAEFLKEFTPAV